MQITNTQALNMGVASILLAIRSLEKDNDGNSTVPEHIAELKAASDVLNRMLLAEQEQSSPALTALGNPILVIEMSGGLLSNMTLSCGDLQVIVLDEDTDGVEPERMRNINGVECVAIEHGGVEIDAGFVSRTVDELQAQDAEQERDVER